MKKQEKHSKSNCSCFPSAPMCIGTKELVELLCATNANEINRPPPNKLPMRINPSCGRDKSGVFHCVCGECKPLKLDGSHNCDNRGYNCGDS